MVLHVALQYDRLKNISRKSESKHIENLYHKKTPDHSEIPLHTHDDRYNKKTWKITSVGRNWNLQVILLEIQNGAAVVDNSLADFETLNIELSYDSALNTPRYIQKELKKVF